MAGSKFLYGNGKPRLIGVTDNPEMNDSEIVPSSKALYSVANPIATGSTEPRALSERFSDVINVKDFGAVGDGVTDDTEAIQYAIDTAKENGGNIVYFPAGVYIQSDTIIIRDSVCLIGAGNWITTIKKSVGMNKDSIISENFDELKNIEDQQSSPLFPRDMGIIGITLQGQYLSGDVTVSGNSYINTDGGGIKIIGSRYTLDCAVLNQAGIGVFLQAKGKFNHSDKIQNSSIKLNINTCKYECLIFDGPADIFIDTIYAGNSGSTNTPGAGNVPVISPTFGDVNGGLCDNVVFVTGAEIGFLHAWGTYHGVGVRCMNGRINADFIISESNQCGHFVAEGESRGSITKILCHSGGGGGVLRPERQKYPDIHINTSDSLSFHIGSIYMYCRSNVDNGQDKVVIDSPFTNISDLRISGLGCEGNGLIINGSYCTFDNVYINNLTGNTYDSKLSAAITRNAKSQTFFTRINAMVITVPLVFRSIGACRTEDINIFYSLKQGSSVFEGKTPTFGLSQKWNISGTIDNIVKSTTFKGRVAFNPTITEEQSIEIEHNLIFEPNISDILLTIQDTGTSLQSGMIQYMYVNSTNANKIVIKLKMKEAGTNTSPFITIYANISS